MLISWLVLTGRWRVSSEEGVEVESFVLTLLLAAAEIVCELLWLSKLFG